MANSIFWILIFFVLYIVLNLVDVYLTRRILKAGGREKNPLIRIFGIWRFKIAFMAALILFLIFFSSYWYSVLLPINAWGFAICYWNYLQYKEQRR